MKVVGTTDSGYLVQITRTELGIIMGFGQYPDYGDTRADFQDALGGKEPRTNVEIPVGGGNQYLRKIHSNLKDAQDAAAKLREIANILDNPLPLSIQPTKEEKDLALR
jgi:hypothetical protein